MCGRIVAGASTSGALAGHDSTGDQVPHVPCYLCQLLARVDRQVRRRCPPLAAPTRLVGSESHAQLDVSVLMTRFDPELSLERFPLTQAFPTGPVSLQPTEEVGQVSEARGVVVYDPPRGR
jgi:hypothetical protein